MEIPFIVSGITRFQNPSFLLYLRALSTYAALIIAAIAAFSSLIRRSKRRLLSIRRRSGSSVITPPSSSSNYFSDADDDDYEEESCSSSSDDESDVGQSAASSDSESEEEFARDFDEIQGLNGDFAREGSVVKFWESGDIPAVHVASQGTVVIDWRESEKSVGIRLWDARAGGGAPAAAASATWQGGRVVGVGGGCSEVYVWNDVGQLAVVDLRSAVSTSADSWSWKDT